MSSGWEWTDIERKKRRVAHVYTKEHVINVIIINRATCCSTHHFANMKFAFWFAVSLLLSTTVTEAARLFEQANGNVYLPSTTPRNENLQEDKWLKVLTNEKFQGYSVRIKKPQICDEVAQVQPSPLSVTSWRYDNELAQKNETSYASFTSPLSTPAN